MNTDDVERWRRVDALFNALIDLAPEVRAAYLDAHCPDAGMRRDVEALLDAGDTNGARHAWEQGVIAAQGHGDKQAEKEMTVFLRKLDKQQP